VVERLAQPSFQRKVSGTAATAPAAARTRAVGMPRCTAACPQIRLPALIAPKKTVTKTDSPRALTQSGSAVCAETFRLERTAI